MVATYNSIVLQHSEAFQKLHHRSKMMFFDTHGFLSKILDHPSDYGIKNITQFCPNYNAPDISTNYAAYGCSPIQEYFW
jgi:phospholipase/lecithinase/hemolysin